MTHFTQDQLIAALAALGISPPNGEVRPDANGNASAKAATGALHTFFCFNCTHPNVIPVSAVPTMTAFPLARSRNPVSSVHATAMRESSSPTQAPITHRPTVAPVAPVAQRAPVALPSAVPSGPISQVPANVQPVGVDAGTPSVGPASYTSPTVGPDGPWYVVSKGRSVGIFKGWQNVSSLVTGVGRACFFRHPSRASALAAFNEALANGSMEIL